MAPPQPKPNPKSNPTRWGHLSVFGACVAVIGFIFAIVRMFMWRPFAQIYLVTPPSLTCTANAVEGHSRAVRTVSGGAGRLGAGWLAPAEHSCTCAVWYLTGVLRALAPQFTAALVDFLILPVWILWLASQLRNLSSMGAYASSMEMAPALTMGATNKSAEAEADANVV